MRACVQRSAIQQSKQASGLQQPEALASCDEHMWTKGDDARQELSNAACLTDKISYKLGRLVS